MQPLSRACQACAIKRLPNNPLGARRPRAWGNQAAPGGAEPALVTRPPPPGYPASHVHMWGGTCLPGGERGGAAGRGPRPAGGTQVSRTRRGMTAPRKQVTGASHRAASHSKSHGKGTKLPGPAGGHTRGWTPEGPSPPRGGAGAATNAKGRRGPCKSDN